MYYSSFGALALVINLIINSNVLAASKKKNSPATKLRYKYFLIVMILFYVSDILWGVLYERRAGVFVYIDTVIFFASMAASVYLWTRYVVAYLAKKGPASKAFTLSGLLIVVFEAVMLTVNFFFPVVFRFEEDGLYVPLNARYITLAAQIALFFAVAAYTFAVTVKTEAGKARRRHAAVGISCAVMTVFIVMQTVYELLPFYSVGCLIASCILHVYVVEDDRRQRLVELGSATHMAYTDSLTGVKNTHAYVEEEKRIDLRIADGQIGEFAVVVFDLNGLKYVNDNFGHEAGDNYLKSAGRMICGAFKRSPVYRIGGDEFVAILTGADYEDRERLLRDFDRAVEESRGPGAVVIASGMDVFRPGEDNCYIAVFNRADGKMYEHKRLMKEKEAR